MYRLVIIDTDECALNCITQAVNWNELGFRIAAAFSSGDAAVEYIKSTPADAVLLSAELPGIPGMDVAAFIHRNWPDCRVVMLSSLRDYDLMKKAMQCGVCDHLLKPVDPEELCRSLEMIREKLDRSMPALSHMKEQCSGAYEPLKDERKHSPDKSRGHHKENNSSAVLVQQVKDYIARHILESVSLEDVSKQMHISTSHLIRIFKKETGYTYLAYVTKEKMDKAAEYLKKDNLKVYEVSEMLGYHSTRHFSTLFFKQFGCYPSEYSDTLDKD